MKKISFNDKWTVTETGLTDDPFAGAADGHNVTLPHDAMISKTRIPELSGGAAQGYFPDGDYLYEKNFICTEEEAAGKCFIEFESVYNNSSIFINGNHAGGCRYGYTDFYIDASPYITEGRNTIRVEAKPGFGRNTRWYTGNGILRNVYIHKGGSTGLVPGELRVLTAGIDSDDRSAELLINGKVYGYDVSDCLQVECAIAKNEDPEIAAALRCNVDENGEFSGRVQICEAQLWSAETPALYQLKAVLLEDGMHLDDDNTVFGIRTVEAIPGKGLLINGEPVKLRGGCIHADDGITGAAEYEPLSARRIRILKEAGFNAVRSSHHPASKAILDACDSIGMYVMDESFDTWNVSKTQYDYTLWFAENWRRDLDSLVRKDFNHPSVIMYTIGNEIKELDTKQGIEQNRIMYEYLKSLDQTRPVSNAVNGMFTAMSHMPEIMSDIMGDTGDKAGISGDINEVMSFLDSNMDRIMCHKHVTDMLDPICFNLDIAGYNYMGARYDMDTAMHPDRIIVGSETRPDSIASNWSEVMRLPNVIGDFVWTAWDYIGEAGIGRIDHDELNGPMYGRYPWMLSCTGDIDISGNRKPQSYYREIVWGLRNDPYIAVGKLPDYGKPARTSNWSWNEVVRSWSWQGYEGVTTHIEVYSNADEVELFLNGRSLDRKHVGEDMPYAAMFEVPYSEGELIAVSYIDGVQTGSDRISSAKGRKMLRADIESGSPSDNSGDLFIANITIGDSNGVIDFRESASVKITVKGPAEILGFGNTDPRTEESYSSDTHTAFEGRLQAVVRKCNHEEIAEISFSCEEIGDTVTVTI